MASTPNGSNGRGFNFAHYFLGSPRDEHGSSGSDFNLQSHSESSEEHNAIIAVLQGRRQPHQHRQRHHHHHADNSSDSSDDEEDRLYSSLPNLFGEGGNNNVDHIRNSSTHSNLFPTRSNDLRHVDQRVNYMDAEAAVYDEPSDSEDYYSDSEQQEEDLAYYGRQRFRPPRSGSIGRIQQGLQALRTGKVPRTGSLGSLQLTPAATAPAVKQQAIQKQPDESKKSHSMSFLSDISDRNDRRKSILEIDTGVATHDPVKRKPMVGVPGSLFWRVRWKRFSLAVFLVLVASLLAWTCRDHGMYYMMKHGDALDANTSPAIPNTSSAPVPTTLLPSTDQGSIARRKLVLEHVIEHDLLPLHPGHESDLLLTSPAARKAMTWMIGHDVTSMELLDQYHFYHHNAPEMIQLNKHYTTNRDEIFQKNKILDRYVMAAAYFKEHPNADARVVVLN